MKDAVVRSKRQVREAPLRLDGKWARRAAHLLLLMWERGETGRSPSPIAHRHHLQLARQTVTRLVRLAWAEGPQKRYAVDHRLLLRLIHPSSLVKTVTADPVLHWLVEKQKVIP